MTLGIRQFFRKRNVVPATAITILWLLILAACFESFPLFIAGMLLFAVLMSVGTWAFLRDIIDIGDNLRKSR